MSDDKISTPERFDKPLYEGFSMDDYADQVSPFTVTVAGAERHDGEAPYVYVVEDHSRELAWGQALAWHIVNQEDIDSYVVASESFDGVPPEDFKGHWNDLRPETKGRAKLEELGQRAAKLNSEYLDAIAPFMDDEGNVKEGSYREYDAAADEYGTQALELVGDVAMYAKN